MYNKSINYFALPAANTKQFDNVLRALWEEHKIAAFHTQDGRLPNALRGNLAHLAAKRYGERK